MIRITNLTNPLSADTKMFGGFKNSARSGSVTTLFVLALCYGGYHGSKRVINWIMSPSALPAPTVPPGLTPEQYEQLQAASEAALASVDATDAPTPIKGN